MFSFHSSACLVMRVRLGQHVTGGEDGGCYAHALTSLFLTIPLGPRMAARTPWSHLRFYGRDAGVQALAGSRPQAGLLLKARPEARVLSVSWAQLELFVAPGMAGRQGSCALHSWDGAAAA